MDKVTRTGQSLLYLLSIMPRDKNAASFGIKAKQGVIDTFNLQNSDEFAIDLIRLRCWTETDYAWPKRSVLFKPVRGECTIKYLQGVAYHEETVTKIRSHEIGRGVKFRLKTENDKCTLILILGKKDD